MVGWSTVFADDEGLAETRLWLDFESGGEYNTFRLGDATWDPLRTELASHFAVTDTAGYPNFLSSMTYTLTYTRWFSMLLTVDALYPTQALAQDAADSLRHALEGAQVCPSILDNYNYEDFNWKDDPDVGYYYATAPPGFDPEHPKDCFWTTPATGLVDGAFEAYDNDYYYGTRYPDYLFWSKHSLGWDDFLGAYHAYPEVYRWKTQTTSSELQVKATGLQVDKVYFEPSCLASGCWKVEITYTLGENNFNALYIPKTPSGTDTLAVDPTYTQTELDTFQPAKHPCRSTYYDPEASQLAGGSPPAEVTACCIPTFLENYRTTGLFNFLFSEELSASDCTRTWSTEDIWEGGVIEYTYAYWTSVGNNYWFDHDNDGEYIDQSSLHPLDFMLGPFSGMENESNVVFTGLLDPYIQQYKAVVVLDEVALRNKAGLLRGTVGVEYTVDTFIGISDSPDVHFTM